MDISDTQKLAAVFFGLFTVAGILARLYHNRVVAGKDNEIKARERSISELQGQLAKAQHNTPFQSESTTSAQDLVTLSAQIARRLEAFAGEIGAQAASLYAPLNHVDDEENSFPRGFAFIATCNADPDAARKAAKLGIVENWTVVGQCWINKQLIFDNDLQKNSRHLSSYDKQTGFVPVHTLLSPIYWQQRPIGVIQFLNKASRGDPHELDAKGFESDCRLALQRMLSGQGGIDLADHTRRFLEKSDWPSFLGLHEEVFLENVTIMHFDLTNSSYLFDELPQTEAARMINRFSVFAYQSIAPYSAVVEKFSGDGAMARFHFDTIEHQNPNANAAYRAASAAAHLLAQFDAFKAKHWKRLAQNISDQIRLRITISLGPVLAINAGPRQIESPTIFGPAVNRSAKMIAHAPRTRDIILIDENVRKATLLASPGCAFSMSEFSEWRDNIARSTRCLADFEYFEIDGNDFLKEALPPMGRQ